MHASYEVVSFFFLVHVPRPCNCDTTSIIVNSSSSTHVFYILYSIVLMIVPYCSVYFFPLTDRTLLRLINRKI